jgi:hypothetical protein
MKARHITDLGMERCLHPPVPRVGTLKGMIPGQHIESSSEEICFLQPHAVSAMQLAEFGEVALGARHLPAGSVTLEHAPDLSMLCSPHTTYGIISGGRRQIRFLN